MILISDRMARTFNRYEAAGAVTLAISKSLNRVWHADVLYKLKSYGISVQVFDLFSSFFSTRRFRVFLDGKLSQ